MICPDCKPYIMFDGVHLVLCRKHSTAVRREMARTSVKSKKSAKKKEKARKPVPVHMPMPGPEGDAVPDYGVVEPEPEA